MPTSTTRQYGIKINLSGLDPRSDGDRSRIVAKLADSVVHSFSAEAFPAVNPQIRIRLEPHALFCDLIVTPTDLQEALEWKIREWNENAFRANVLKGIAISLDHWAEHEFAVVTYANDTRYWTAST